MDAPAHPSPARRRLVLRQAVARVFSAFAFAAAITTAIADEPARQADGPAFQPGEISIGEPIALPFGAAPSNVPAAPPAALANEPRATLPPAAASDAPVPGSGWLGLVVGKSTVPGRWRVEEVTAGGPAARAGILPGDELRAVNGTTLASDEQVSQALTAVVAGRDVRVAVARADHVSEVVLRAAARPAAPPRQFAAAVPAAPDREVSNTSPPAADAPAWQASPRRDEPAPASRFGGGAVDTPPPTMPSVVSGAVPAPFVPPKTAAPTLGDAPATGRIALGVRTVPIDPPTQARFRLPEPTGAYVVGVVQELPAAKAGLPPGSVIVAVGDRPVRSPLELTRIVETGPLDRPIPVQFVLPGGESKRANVVLQSLDAALERALVGEPAPVAGTPQLRPGPEQRRADRPADDEAVIRAEIRAIRSRLDILERLLDPLARRQR